MWTVYMHISPSNKFYIGITSQTIEERWRNGEGYKTQPFYNAIQKYGWDNFEHVILFENLTEEEAKEKEIELIAEYHSDDKYYGYNILKGGNMGKHGIYGFKYSEESKRKMSENHADVSGANNPSAKRVYCPELNEYFDCMLDANKKYGVRKSGICLCCNKKQHTAGKHPETGEKLHWQFA